MIKGKKAILLYFIFGLAIQASAQSFFGSQPFIQNYSNKDFRTIESQVWSITSDDVGRMIFGHNNGVLIFDAHKWQVISLPNKSFVRSVHSASDHRIYVGGVGELGYLVYDHVHGYQYHSLVHLIPDAVGSFNDVWDVFETPEGILFNTSNTLLVFANNKIRVLPASDKATRVFNIEGQIIYQRQNGGIYMIKDGTDNILPGTSTIKNTIRFIEEVNDDTWMIGIDNARLTFYDKQKGVLFSKPETERTSAFLQTNRIYCEQKINEGHLAIGTFYGGIVILDTAGHMVNNIDNNGGLIDNMVYDIYCDKKGNIWAGLNLGISYVLVHAPLSVFDKNMGLISGAASAYSFTDELIIGSMSGAYSKKPGQPLTLLPGTVGPTGNMIEINDGVCFSHYSGVFYYKNGHLTNKHDHITRSILRLIKPSNILLGSTIDNGLALFEITAQDIEFRHFIKGFDDHSPFLAQDTSGAIWISKTNKGVYRLMLNDDMTEVVENQFFDASNGLPSNTGNRVSTLTMISDHPQVLFCTEQGIYQYKDEQFEPYQYLKTWIADTGEVKNLSEDQFGNIFIQFNDHNGVLKKSGKDTYTLIDKPFLKFRNISTESISSQDECNIQFATDEGLYNYDMCHDTAGSNDFKIILTQIYINDNPAYRSPPIQKEEIWLPSDSNNVKFEFTALFYEQHHETTYAYMLEGFDDEWSPWGYNQEKEYTNLPAGHYSFRVKAKNIYEEEMTMPSLHMHIKPPWYQTIWAYLLLLCALIILVWGAVKWRIYNLEKEKKYLQKVVDESTRSIMMQKEEIEAQSDKLQEANDMKDKLFSIIAHDLRSPINSLSGLLQLAENGTLTKLEFNKFIPELSQNVNANRQLLTNLLHWSKNQLRNEEFNPVNFDVWELIRQNVALYQTRAAEKNVSLEAQETPDIYMVCADKGMIDLVIRNLVANAVKFTKACGQISVWAEEEDENRISVHVKDDGEGISQENIKKIFGSKMFSTRGTDNEKGTGLGLKLCKEFVNKNGGEIHLESEEGKGSEFYFTIPKSKS